MVKNSKLKVKLWEKGVSQRTLSEETEIPRAYISLGINGRYLFDEMQRNKIAKALGVQLNEIFDGE